MRAGLSSSDYLTKCRRPIRRRVELLWRIVPVGHIWTFHPEQYEQRNFWVKWNFPITVSQPPPLPSPSLLIVNRLWNNCCAFKNKFIHTKMYPNFVSPELHKNTNYVLFSYAGFLVLSTLSFGVGAISIWGRRHNGIKTQNKTKQQWLHFTILINKCTFDKQFEGKSNSQVCQSAISERLFLVWNEYIKFLNLPWDAHIFAATERKKHQSEQPNWHFL